MIINANRRELLFRVYSAGVALTFNIMESHIQVFFCRSIENHKNGWMLRKSGEFSHRLDVSISNPGNHGISTTKPQLVWRISEPSTVQRYVAVPCSVDVSLSAGAFATNGYTPSWESDEENGTRGLYV